VRVNIIYREKDIPNIREWDTYIANEGFAAFKKAVAMGRDAVIEEVKASNLRGRGGAGFPAGVKWSFIPKSEPVKYVTVNADESEPGTFKDRQILENNPYQLIEGALICAYAIGAKAVYIYMRGEFWDVAQQVDACIAKVYENGFAGENILDSGWSCDVYTHLGAGAYICGEESALIESLEGKLGQPRVRPPFPAQKGGGLYGEPTVVNNVETLANVPYIIRVGAAEYKKLGTEQSTGTKIFCLSGHVNKPGNYEIEFGKHTLRDLIFEFGGGIPGGKQVKAVLPSGASGPIVPATDAVLDTPLTYEDFQKIGTILGSASIIIMDETVDATWVASKVTKFFKHESCGKCTPCREGTYWLDKTIDRIMAGKAEEGDIDKINTIARNMQGVTLCALGDFAANPILYTIKHFPDDFKQHVAKKVEEEAAAPAKGAAAGARKGGAAARRSAAPAGD
jgi:NADH-quinone oxidoreductase subunit F